MQEEDLNTFSLCEQPMSSRRRQKKLQNTDCIPILSPRGNPVRLATTLLPNPLVEDGHTELCIPMYITLPLGDGALGVEPCVASVYCDNVVSFS